MNGSVRVSRKAVLDVLTDKLALALAYDLYDEICRIDDEDARNMVGMTVKEWRERFDNEYRIVWAADTCAGFGKAGDSVYGNPDDLVIVETDRQGGTWSAPEYTLRVWSTALHTDDRAINAALKLWAARTGEEVTA